MPRLILLFLLFTISYITPGQVNFRTVAPQQPVIAGEPFEVQFIIDGEENIETFTAPAFTGFRFVSGPHVYKGSIIDLNVNRPLVNTVYTLLPLRPGRYIIHGAKATINGSDISSNDVFVEVISKEEAFKLNKRKDGSFYSNSEYFLRPGEDPIKKIKQNLFLKVTVDKRNCYVGEPVTATFKLYSRLESKSDIVKNPGFYGFAVHDMISLADKKKQTEIVHGKTFDVHTVRQVQLYPLQAGQFTIDPMEVSNKVEFSRSEISKKTEQEIAEGVLGKDNSLEMHNNTEVYETSMKTEAVPVSVKPLPAKNKTDSFTAAVGRFTVRAELKKNEVAKNEQDSMIISVSGEGNFTQITPPVIDWPAGIEGFEPVVEDSIDRLSIPLAGTKTFRYTFVSDKSGSYDLPVIRFPFFNPVSKKFETASTQPLKVQVSNREKEKTVIPKPRKAGGKITITYWWLGVIAILGLLTITAILLISGRKKNTPVETITEQEEQVSVDSILLPAQMILVADDTKFYNELNKAIWNYFGQKTNFSGSEMNKAGLLSFLRSSGIEPGTINELLSVLQLCEAGIYTTAVHAEDKKQVFDKTRKILTAIDGKLG